MCVQVKKRAVRIKWVKLYSMCAHVLVCACSGVCVLRQIKRCVRTQERSKQHWTNPTLMFLFLIKHTLLFCVGSDSTINVNGPLRAVYHHLRVKLAVKGARSSTITGLDESGWTATQNDDDLLRNHTVPL